MAEAGQTEVKRAIAARRQRRARQRVLLFLLLVFAVAFWLLEAIEDTWLIREIYHIEDRLLGERDTPGAYLLLTAFYGGGVALTGLLVWLLVRQERRRAALEAKLDEAMTRLLSGFVPICMYCKNIRENGGDRWRPIETYLASRTDLKFSHGLCPQCFAEHYPDEPPPP